MSNARILLLATFLPFAGAFPLFEFLAQSAKGGEDKKVVEPKVGEERDFELAHGVKMKFCWIPAGEAQLGSPKEEQDYIMKIFHDGDRQDYLDDETEEKRGRFKTQGFWLGKYTITQEEWKAVMGENPSFFQPDGRGKDKLLKDKISNTSWFPVEQVSWDDSQIFLGTMNALGVAKVFGNVGQFVLPHEDEWEYACRGGSRAVSCVKLGNPGRRTLMSYGENSLPSFTQETALVVVRGTSRHSTLGMNLTAGKRTAMAKNRMVQTRRAIIRSGQRWWGVMRRIGPTPGVCVICREMFGSGVRTGMSEQ